MTEQRKKILELLRLGMKPDQIAAQLGCNHGTVYRAARERRRPAYAERLAAIEDMVAESLVLLRQLNRLPRKTIDARIKALLDESHDNAQANAVPGIIEHQD